MNNKENHWTEEVFQSMEGSSRAKPKPDLWSKIETGISNTPVKRISMIPRKTAIAAAVAILFINVFAFYQLNINENANSPISEIESPEGTSLISDYQFYD